MDPVRVLIVDDQPLFRAGLRVLLGTSEAVEVVGEAADGREAVALAKAYRPRVALMDLRMPVMDGIDATRLIKESCEDCDVIALTTFDDDQLIVGALQAGARGYLLKDCSAAVLFDAIRLAARGESALSPEVATKVVDAISRLPERAVQQAATPSGLSKREHEVLRLLGRGRSNKEIAGELFLAEGTVKNHLTRIFEKLEVSDRTQAVLRGTELGLLRPQSSKR